MNHTYYTIYYIILYVIYHKYVETIKPINNKPVDVLIEYDIPHC